MSPYMIYYGIKNRIFYKEAEFIDKNVIKRKYIS